MAERQNPIVLVRDIFENQRARGWVVRRAVAKRPLRCENIAIDGDQLSQRRSRETAEIYIKQRTFSCKVCPGTPCFLDYIKYSPVAWSKGKPGIYIAPSPMSPLKPGNCYFKMEVLEPGEEGHIIVGLVPGNKPREKPHNWKTDSVAYYRSDGSLHTANGGVQQKFGLPWVAGDVVGCGINLEGASHNNADKSHIQVYFTVNGHKLCTLVAQLPPEGLHPAIGMFTHSPEGARVRLSLNASWESSGIIPMSIDSWEEDWVRQDSIRLNGQLLEYTGRLPTVGLAQPCHPLDTRNHYFEIEIVNPGELCRIAIGVAGKDYPKNQLPGWRKGSIAYHADDGHIFIGNGHGEPFGPVCNKGSVMGCGILFPREYKAEADMCENVSLVPPMDDIDNSDSEEEVDDEWVNKEGGTKVQVFFTRNGKTIGKREIRIARGGFYPTVGMQSTNEKVRIDLRPLTG